MAGKRAFHCVAAQPADTCQLNDFDFDLMADGRRSSCQKQTDFTYFDGGP